LSVVVFRLSLGADLGGGAVGSDAVAFEVGDDFDE
jgi:hypothetical protein